MPAISFADHYSEQQYFELLDHWDASPRSDDGRVEFHTPAYEAWTAKYRQHCKAAEASIGSYLKALASSRQLATLPESALYLRTHRLAHAWNALASGAITDRQLERLTKSFNYGLLVSGRRTAANITRHDLYHEMINKADKGTLEWWENESREKCETTDEDVYFELKDWSPRLGSVDHAKTHSEFEPLQPLPKPSVCHHIIPTPSGELLIADWFRIEGFNEAVKDSQSEGHYSVNSASGKLRQTAWYASQGFASVFVSDTLPKVVERGDHIVIARVDEDGELGEPEVQGNVAGYVCTDLWWATAIDREVLTSILARKQPRQVAEKAVAEWIQSPSAIVTVLKVPVGQLHVYHTARPEDMQEFCSSSVPNSSIEQLYAVLSQRELDWSPKGAATDQNAPVQPTRAVRKGRTP